MNSTPTNRIRLVNDAAVANDGEYVVYWMIANRRTESNYALQRAVEHCRDLKRPLLVVEALRCGYRWASDRLHRFVLQGMADNRRAFDKTGVRYLAYVEPEAGAGSGMLEAIARKACVVVTDDFPCFFLPRMLAAAGRRLNVCLEAVDSNGILPLSQTDRVFKTAHSFRRHLQKELRPFLIESPEQKPWAAADFPEFGGLPEKLAKRWPEADDELLLAGSERLQGLPIDHTVGPAAFDGGALAAGRILDRFIQERLPDYAKHRNQPEQEAASGLSPYLHFGHISAHRIFAAIAARESWNVQQLATTTTGSREGWWQMSPESESFLDELITWREIGYNRCANTSDYDRYESLPDWARASLEKHESDPREHVYSPDEFAAAETHDELWNAAQRQLLREGRMHNYLRMLWGKKVLEWSASPRDALDTLIELNNRYAVDGRNPNSYSGIFWCLGRYDRAWGPERPIFGKIRYMSSENTARKLRVRNYLKQYAAADSS